jgi:uncharacterized delta-60 repeat protein
VPCYLNSAALLSNGDILAAGSSGSYPDEKIAIARYKPNGSPDSSFGIDGKVINTFGEVSSVAYKIIVAQDGKLIVAGNLLTRLNSDGTPDQTFGSGGKATNFQGAEYAVLQTDAKIVTLNTPNFSLQRFNGSPISAGIQQNISKLEGNLPTTQAAFKVVLNAASITTVTVNFTTVDGTAKNGEDYIGTSGTLTFKPGQTSKSVSVTILGDNINEPNETFSLQLGDPKNAILGTLSTARCTIKNDDAAFSVTALNSINKASNDIVVYPNPAKDFFHITGLNKNSTTTISIIGLQGSVLAKTTTTNSSYTWNVKQLPAGSYYVRIEADKNVSTLRFVKE